MNAQKRLTLLGPESVGKTTLAARLAKHFDTRLVPEYGRTYDEKYMQSRFKQGKGWRVEDLLAIAETHAAMRAAISSSERRPIIGPAEAMGSAASSSALRDGGTGLRPE